MAFWSSLSIPATIQFQHWLREVFSLRAVYLLFFCFPAFPCACWWCLMFCLEQIYRAEKIQFTSQVSTQLDSGSSLNDPVCSCLLYYQQLSLNFRFICTLEIISWYIVLGKYQLDFYQAIILRFQERVSGERAGGWRMISVTDTHTKGGARHACSLDGQNRTTGREKFVRIVASS